MTATAVDRIRASWTGFTKVYNELLELGITEGVEDDGALSALLGRLIGNIQYSGLRHWNDPANPQLINAQYSPWNWGHSNPDTLYLSAQIDDAHDYRVYGKLGTVAETTFGMYTGSFDQSKAVKVRTQDLRVEADGSFEIFFTHERHGDNWFQVPDGVRSMGTYQTYENWDTQAKGTIRIECLNPGAPAGPRSVTDAAEQFDRAVDEARELFTMWARDIPERVFRNLPVNTSLTPMQPPAAMAGAWFSPIPWRLEDGEALVIDYTIPDDCTYTGICLTNQWSQMFDIESRQTSLNLAQTRVDGNHVRILLAAEDVGIANWLDARGYRGGLATWRASAPEAPAAPEVTKIAIDDVPRYFASDQHVTEAERAAAIAARLHHFAERNTP
jgi:hypothetical protein